MLQPCHRKVTNFKKKNGRECKEERRERIAQPSGWATWKGREEPLISHKQQGPTYLSGSCGDRKSWWHLLKNPAMGTYLCRRAWTPQPVDTGLWSAFAMGYFKALSAAFAGFHPILACTTEGDRVSQLHVFIKPSWDWLLKTPVSALNMTAERHRGYILPFVLTTKALLAQQCKHVTSLPPTAVGSVLHLLCLDLTLLCILQLRTKVLSLWQISLL